MAKLTPEQKQAAAAAKQAASLAKKQSKTQSKYLKKNLSSKKLGPQLSIDEFTEIKGGSGIPDTAIIDYAKSKGMTIDEAILNPPKPPEKEEGEPAEIPGFKPSDAEGLTPAVFDYEKALNLLNAQGNINTNIQKLESDANKYIAELNFGVSKDVANIQAGAARDVATTEAGATRYVADRQLESNLGVENIRTKGAIDLQEIINSGAERVETIRGDYGLKGKKIDRSTAILGGLVSSFNF